MSKLYIISPPEIVLKEFLPKLEAALKKYRPAMFQLRLKHVDDAAILEDANQILTICHAFGVKFIVNDSPVIAHKCGADGVHLGDDDMTVAEARQFLGVNAIIGKSCYNSLELAEKAESEGASYVSFGAFYPTKTKVAKARAEISTLTKWKAEHKTPASVIGGIDFENMKPLEEAGADYICMVSAIWG